MSSKVSAHPALDGQYVIHKTLGSGGFAKVKLATHLLTGEKVAIKIMDKAALKEDLSRVQVEIDALKHLSHQNVCQLYQVLESETKIYLVMEYCPGGELFDYIFQRQRLKEDEARVFFRQIVAAVAYIHRKGFAHRDLKPENLLIHGDRTIKLIDFGLCANPKGGLMQHLKTCCGSPAYAAPELISGEDYNGSKVDVWSMGVLLFTLLCGYLPFDDDNETKLYRKIQLGKYCCPSWLSIGSRLVLADMLQVDPHKRIRIDQLLNHQWVIKGLCTSVQWQSVVESDLPDSECLQELATYYGKSSEEIESTLRQGRYDSLTSTYLLLVSMKRQGKKPALVRSTKKVLKEVKQINRNLTSEFNSSNLESRASMDNLDDIDLLWMASPKERSNRPKTKDKENFLQPPIPTPRKTKKKNKTSQENEPPLKTTSLEFGVNKATNGLISGFSLAQDKRAKSADSPLCPSSQNTPVRRPPWENAGQSAKKLFGSIEKRLDSVRTMLTPNKPIYACGISVPRKIKTMCNVSAVTEDLTPDEVLESLQRALQQKGVYCKRNGYVLKGKVDHGGRTVLKFELEVCLLPQRHMVGVRRKRLIGDAWHYKRVCEEVLKLAVLTHTAV